ncbi:carbohydrate-binding protein [Thermococcus sp.]
MKRGNISLLLVVLMVLSIAPSVYHPWVSGATTISLDGKALAWDVVNLTWSPYNGAKAYKIYRATDPSVLLSPSHLLVVVNWSSYPQYEAGKTYYQGDIVEYNGQIWQAKYWTQSAPGGDAWELIGDAVPTTNYLPVEPHG